MLQCLFIIFLCLLMIALLPAFALAFVVCIIGLVLKVAFAVIGIGLKITFSSVFLVGLLVAVLIFIF